MVQSTYPELDTPDGQDAVHLCVDLVLFPRVYPSVYEWFLLKVCFPSLPSFECQAFIY